MECMLGDQYVTQVSPVRVSSRFLMKLLEKDTFFFFFLTTEAAELDECQSGAARAILTTPEGKMIEEDAHTKGERPRLGENP